ncbi:TraB family pheromone shut-down protein [Alkalihalophilus pseudofirmus OF4]|uniref:TraB family pheromone shut-down protein n=1 Tax=Alkalihalophilus pseudofirmus (strain ATCC BAA-2126 / JCM 17055 / OF4) TaxID=398511 RepID=D3FTK3_ALKPO|nr:MULTISPECIES: TraB/GumN family protein [Alkalihalophilus]ADC50076.1 TraB family pheromone shut-down protein [Alkalihalophilus pseudofirmus OF4]MED1599825.1 TraB/GumN family protein [Alkalihalophilus marmarensis]OLS36330.1 conjugal transfer protein TraB [Alkalihalophilus pseudofirmus]WEG17383.1 TraB/GumN family protein [Alkalihalophilus pseudofirmus]
MSEQNITRIHLNGKELILIGTAHVSKQSAEEVKQVIEAEQPDSVCVELDEQRYQSITAGNKWKDMDIFKVIKEKKATLLLMNLFISSFQKRMAKQFDIKPGQEMIQGIESAKETGAELVLADRNIQITFSRIWHGVGLWGRAKLLMSIVYSVFNNEEISEEELERLKTEDMLNTMLHDLTVSFPRLKKPLIDERDQYLAQKIKEAPGDKVVAVLGAAHVPGIKEQIKQDHDLDRLNERPKKSIAPSIIGWMIPILILGMIGYAFYTNPSVGADLTLSWVLWNSAFAAIGAAIAFGHPLTILTALILAPLTSLYPLLAAGWFAGLVEAYIRKPKVADFESLSDDVYSVKGFWSNNVTRILLVVVLTNLGSTLGTVIGGADVVRQFMQNIFG